MALLPLFLLRFFVTFPALGVSGGHRLHRIGGQNCTLGPGPGSGLSAL